MEEDIVTTAAIIDGGKRYFEIKEKLRGKNAETTNLIKTKNETKSYFIMKITMLVEFKFVCAHVKMK